MFGIGGLEFLIIIIAAILFIGPKDLPKVLYELGKIARKLRAMSKSITDGLDDLTKEAELDDIVKQANIVGDEMTEFRIQQQQALDARDVKPKRKPTQKKTVKKKPKAKAKPKVKPKVKKDEK